MTKKNLYILLLATTVVLTLLAIIIFRDRDRIKFSPIPIQRYEITLMNIDTDRVQEELERLYTLYPIFLYGADLYYEGNLQQIYDFITCPRTKSLLNDVLEKYPNLTFLEYALGESFARYNRFFDRDIIPTIFTYISHLDYDNRVIFLDTILLIAIDMYLGADNEHYNALALPMYMRRRLETPFIAVDVMRAVAHYELERTPQPQPMRTLLDHMILHGKVAYFLARTLPRTDMAVRFGFTPEQMVWAQRHERLVWSYLVGEQLLFEENLRRFRAYVNEAPTVQIFPGSPGRIGHFLGYRIVRQYMENTGKTIPELFAETNSQNILRLSNYRP
ncbi:MAG: DUF2268 domain-containing protein [Bacteroidales bacterium]|nr:DUF2268 domain-containing protein [Bacteroidales bacterium]